MKKILCPTNFSDCSVNAIAYASKLAHATGSGLTLMKAESVLEPADLDAVNDNLEVQAKVVRQMFNIPCDFMIDDTMKTLSGSISDCARDYDLVVMGTDGPDGLFELFFGTNAYNASLKSDTPVLIVPEGVVFTAATSIAYAFNYLQEIDVPMGKLLDFALALQSSITVVAVVESPHSSSTNAALRDRERTLKNLYSEAVPVSFDTVRSDNPAEGIHDYMVHSQADVLAICTKDRGLAWRTFHHSVTKYITAICNYPLFIFHG